MDDKDKFDKPLSPEDITNPEETAAETPSSTPETSREEKIETEWAKALHLDYDPEEARRRAEEINSRASAQTPPPMPNQEQQTANEWPPRNEPPAPAPQPFENVPQPAPYHQPEPMPQTYLVWSVLATVFCCLIPGIVAIIYSTMVSSKYYAKDYEGSKKASEMAQYWIIASVVLGVITAAVFLPLSLLA